MDRNQVILGVVIAMVLLAALKIPAIPVETQSSQVYTVEGVDEEVVAGDGSTERVATATPEPSEGDSQTTDSGDSQQDGGAPGPVMIDKAGGFETEYEVPIDHEIVDVAVSLSGDGELVSEVTVENTDETAGKFGVVLRHRKGESTERIETDRTEISPGETATFVGRYPVEGELDGQELNVSVVAESKTITSTSEPEQSSAGKTVWVYDVAMDHEIVSLNSAFAAGSDELGTELVLRNDGERPGEFSVTFTYRKGGVEDTETVSRRIEPGETASFTDEYALEGAVADYEVEIEVTPARSVVATKAKGEIERNTDRETITTGVTKRKRVTLLEYLSQYL